MKNSQGNVTFHLPSAETVWFTKGKLFFITPRIKKQAKQNLIISRTRMDMFSYCFKIGSLIDKGAKVEASLHFACEKGHLQIVQCLIEKGLILK